MPFGSGKLALSRNSYSKDVDGYRLINSDTLMPQILVLGARMSGWGHCKGQLGCQGSISIVSLILYGTLSTNMKLNQYV
ncbi:hypothetical protein AM10699_51120 [Acaryochloris marina MBIC10699]|nr:hypothetical protein AM10699_51120 [Acaryochloris marina MBIC10699]